MLRSTASSPTYHPTTPSIQPRPIHPAPPLLESPITSMIRRTCCKARTASKRTSRGVANVSVRGRSGICPAIVNRLLACVSDPSVSQSRLFVAIIGRATDSRRHPGCTGRYSPAPNNSTLARATRTFVSSLRFYHPIQQLRADIPALPEYRGECRHRPD